MASSDDSYEYEDYSLEMYEENEGPPLIKKKSRLIAAVVQNDVETLRDLLESPKWYNVKDKYGYNLLQIAILRDNKEVFDYLLSLPNYPVDFVNQYNDTAIDLAFTGFVSNDIFMDGHFACELVKKGTQLSEKNTFLHYAIERSYFQAAKFLILKGADVNGLSSEGLSPLQHAFFHLNSDENDVCEFFAFLLLNGADPLVSPRDMDVYNCFEYSANIGLPLLVQEMIFLYSCDESLPLNIHMEVIVKMALDRSPLFYKLLKYPVQVIEEVNFPDCLLTGLCRIERDHLRAIIDTYPSFLRLMFSNFQTSAQFSSEFCDQIDIENLNLLAESNLSSDFISFVSNLTIINIIEVLTESEEWDETRVTEFYCFLLSYGLKLSSQDYDVIFAKFGICKLLKLFLYMDVEIMKTPLLSSGIPRLMFDITWDVKEHLEGPHKNDLLYSNQLGQYFADRRIDGAEPPEAVTPRVPLLLELARDRFRKHFIKKFKIRTCCRFYTLLNKLPIAQIDKDILTYEKPLY